MSFVITAELPLGTYRGAGPDGRSEPMPSVARLHAALLCAAGFGPRAVLRENELTPCVEDEHALRWLEEHPPDGVAIPQLTVNRGTATAYRDDGTIKQTKMVGRTKKFPKPADCAVAADGAFVWMWNELPPPQVRAALEALCGDVAYVGTTESPVRLTTSSDPVEATHRLDRDARNSFAPDGVGVDGLASAQTTAIIDSAAPGRTDELMSAHVNRLAAPREGRSGPGYRTDEWSLSDVPAREAIQPLRYAPSAPRAAMVPWDRVILLPMSRAIAPADRVGWAVAAHRALVHLIGEGAPPLMTGAYPPGVPRPDNRLALHLLDPSMPVAGGLSTPTTLAMLVPAGTGPDDWQTLARAVESLQSVRGPGGRLARVVGPIRSLRGDRFWAAPRPDRIRLWRTVPAAVPDTRGERGEDWTFTHAALLSLGFVWKRYLPPVSGRRSERERRLAGAVAEASAAVVKVRPLRTNHVQRYVHRVNEHAVVRPYTACLWLGGLTNNTTVAAIGQSRHLGGGLLVPLDVPEGTDLNRLQLPAEDKDEWHG